ncbi:MAG: hypothetical protein ABI333_24345 [bacterium]
MPPSNRTQWQRPTRAARALVWAPGAIAVLCAWAASAGAVPGRVLSPESTTTIRRLLWPDDLGSDLGQGWRVGDLTVTSDRAVWHLLGPKRNGRALHGALVLRAPGLGRALESAHFSILIQGPVPWKIRVALTTRIQRNDRRNPWTGGAAREPQTHLRSRTPWRPSLLLMIGLLGLALLTLLSLPTMLRATTLPRRDWLLVSVVVVAAWTLRSPCARFMPAHVNAHAYETVQEVKQPLGDDYLAYGNAYQAFFKVVSPGSVVAERLVYEANAALGALSAALLFLTLLLLTRDVRIAFAAALLLAVLPSHVRLSASESRFVLAGFLTLYSVVMTVLYVRRGGFTPALAAGLAWAITTQARPELFLLLLGVPLLYWAVPDRRGRPFGLPVALAGLLFVLVSGEWLLLTAQRLTAGGNATSGLAPWQMLNVPGMLGLGSARAPAAVWFDGRFTPTWLPLLSAVGLVALLVKRRTGTALALLVLAWAGTAAGLSFQHGANNMRLQLVGQPFGIALCAVGLVAVASLARDSRHRLLDVALCCLAAGATLWSHGELVRHVYTPQREYLFVKRTIPRLPDDCRIFYPTSSTKHPSHQPTYLSDEAGRNHYWEPVAPPGRPTLGVRGHCRLWYRPTACYTVDGLRPADIQKGLQRGCAATEQRLRLRPVQVRRIRAAPYHIERYGRKELEIGFYEILP